MTVNVTVVRDGKICIVQREGPESLAFKRTKSKMFKCSICGTPHKRRNENSNPELCERCAKRESGLKQQAQIRACKMLKKL